MHPVDPVAVQLARMAEDLLAHERREPVIHDIVAKAVTMLPGAHHASVMVRRRRGPGYETLGASDEVALACDAHQLTLGEGPGVLGDGSERVRRSGDVGTDPRWPRWGEQAVCQGVRSAMSVRLTGRGDHLGSLNLYSRDLFAFGDEESVELALIFAGHAASALAAVAEISGLRSALDSRHMIGVAQGILMERYGLTLDGAFDVLKRHSSVHNLKLRDVAARLVETGDTEPEPGGAPAEEISREAHG